MPLCPLPTVTLESLVRAGVRGGGGVDLVSIGWLTHSVAVLDIGLDHRG